METPLNGGALVDIRVLDVATFIAGPFCATLMAEFGADVIKVEMPGRGDPMREMGQKYNGVGLTWAQEARNKRGITCDLRSSTGQQIVRELVKQCDVLVENFRPGTMERWGLGYDTLKEVNPRLVMVRISGYGQTGPYSEKPGFGRVAQAFGGLTYLAGFPDLPPVTPGSPTIADYLAGLYGAFATMVALEHRRTSGKGQSIDISLFEGIFRILDNLTIAYQKLGLVRERMDTATANVVPHNHYPTRDGKWVAIACTTDRIFERLAVAIGRPEMGSDPLLPDRRRQSGKPRGGRRVCVDVDEHTGDGRSRPRAGRAGGARQRHKQHRRHIQRPAFRSPRRDRRGRRSGPRADEDAQRRAAPQRKPR